MRFLPLSLSFRRPVTGFLLSALLFAPLLILVLYLASGWLTDDDVHAAPLLLPADQLADAVIVRKEERVMSLMRDGEEVARYKIRLGFSPQGQKAQEGDGRTPEGTYRINRRNPRSRFYLSIGLDYPTARQRAQARRKGINPGGDIFIHGQPNALRSLGLTLPFDWTDGCIAVSDREMEDIYARIAIGTKVTILP